MSTFIFWLFACLGMLLSYCIIGLIFLKITLHICIKHWKMDWHEIWMGEWHWLPCVGWPVYILAAIFHYVIFKPLFLLINVIGGLSEQFAKSEIEKHDTRCCRINK